jgi:hypothetical protein
MGLFFKKKDIPVPPKPAFDSSLGGFGQGQNPRPGDAFPPLSFPQDNLDKTFSPPGMIPSAPPLPASFSQQGPTVQPGEAKELPSFKPAQPTSPLPPPRDFFKDGSADGDVPAPPPPLPQALQPEKKAAEKTAEKQAKPEAKADAKADAKGVLEEESFDLPDFDDNEMKELQVAKERVVRQEQVPPPLPKPAAPKRMFVPEPEVQQEKLMDLRRILTIKDDVEDLRLRVKKVEDDIDSDLAQKGGHAKLAEFTQALNSVQDKLMLIDNKLFG